MSGSGCPREDKTPTPPTKPLPPRGITTKGRARQVPVRPPCAPGSPLGSRGEVWRGGRSPRGPAIGRQGGPRAGGSLTRAGSRGRRRGGGRSPGPAGRRTHRADRRTGGRTADGQGFGHTAAWPLRLPGRNGFRAGRDRSREKGRRRRRRRRRPGEGKRREGAREQGGGARQAAGRGRKKEACRDGSPPVTWESPARGLPTPGVPAAREWKGGGSGHGSPAPYPALRVLPTHGAPTHPLSGQNTLPNSSQPTHPTDPKSTSHEIITDNQ